MTLIITLCATHAPQEVEYVCSSFVWSALWWVLGYTLGVATLIILGGRK